MEDIVLDNPTNMYLERRTASNPSDINDVSLETGT